MIINHIWLLHRRIILKIPSTPLNYLIWPLILVETTKKKKNYLFLLVASCFLWSSSFHKHKEFFLEQNILLSYYFFIFQNLQFFFIYPLSFSFWYSFFTIYQQCHWWDLRKLKKSEDLFPSPFFPCFYCLLEILTNLNK